MHILFFINWFYIISGDLRSKKLTGKQLEQALDSVGITVNKT